MKLWQFIAIITLITVGYAVFNWPDKNERTVDPEIEKIHQQYKPIEKKVDSLNHVIDSLKNKKYDTTIYIERWHKADAVKYLPLDSLLRLFAAQQRFFEDSGYIRRFLCPNPPPIH